MELELDLDLNLERSWKILAEFKYLKVCLLLQLSIMKITFNSSKREPIVDTVQPYPNEPNQVCHAEINNHRNSATDILITYLMHYHLLFAHIDVPMIRDIIRTFTPCISNALYLVMNGYSSLEPFYNLTPDLFHPYSSSFRGSLF